MGLSRRMLVSGEDGTQLSNTYIAAAMDGEGDRQDSQSEQE